MIDDPIVASVRRVREKLASAVGYDVHAIFADMRERESKLGDRLVGEPQGKRTNRDRGREVRLSRTPLPQNRACGSPAHGSPVSGHPRIGIERNGYGSLADFDTPSP